MAYADLTMLKQQLNQTSASTAYDAKMQRDLDAAAEHIEHYCSRTFDEPAGEGGLSTAVVTPRYDRSRGRWVVDVPDLSSLDDLLVQVSPDNDGDFSVNVDATTATGWPYNGNRPFILLILPSSVSDVYAGDGSMKLTGKFGWDTTPATIVEANLILAARYFMRKDAWDGITGSPDASNGENRLQADPDIRLMLRSFRRYWAARSTGSTSSNYALSYGWVF